jgi:Carbohydrate family 9 binding domain-like
MTRRILLLTAAALVAATLACEIPGTASPTPFALPTPNLTLTAIFAPTFTPTEAPPTEVPPPTLAMPTFTVTSTVPTTPGAPTATANPAAGRPNGTPVNAPFLTVAPAIDGNLSDWVGGQSTGYGVAACTYGCNLRSSDSDLSGTVYLGYDSTNLYLAAQVRDDKYVQVTSGRNMYKGDDVEIQFDANLTSDFTSTSLSSDDYQIGLSAGNFGTISPNAYRWYPRALEGSLTTVVVKAKQVADGYTLEAKIPWTVFGVMPKQGDKYGFVVSLSDDDQPGTSVQQSMVSSVATRKLLNPTTWGTLLLTSGGGS